MAEEIIITGKTFEEAMAQAQSEYSGENVQYEIDVYKRQIPLSAQPTSPFTQGGLPV